MYRKRCDKEVVDVMPWLSLLLFDDGCVALWALRHFAMIPVADATGRDLSPSGLAGFAGLIEHTSPTHRGTLGIPITAQPKALSNSISACALWLWMDSKFSDEHRNHQTIRGSFFRVFVRSRTESSTNLGLSQACSVTCFSSSLLMIEQIKGVKQMQGVIPIWYFVGAFLACLIHAWWIHPGS